MRFFYGKHRRLSIFPIFLFLAGWVIYLVGFLKRMINPYQRWGNYPAMAAACLAPLIAIAALLQSCLSGPLSATMGSLTAAGTVIFLVSLGNSSITSATSLYHYNSTTEELSIAYPSCTLIGSIICSLSLTVLLSLWGCYRDPVSARYATLQDDDDDANPHGSSYLCPGLARKVAIGCIIFSCLGWCLMVGGHFFMVKDSTYDVGFFKHDFGEWSSFVLTPLLFIFAIIHASSSGPASSVMGIVNALLNGFVLISIGYLVVHDWGAWLAQRCSSTCDFAVPQNHAALCEIIGVFLTCFFWGCVLGLWPFYKKQSKQEGSHSINISLGYNLQRGSTGHDLHHSRQMEEDAEPLEL